jgi:hypothetical protein
MVPTERCPRCGSIVFTQNPLDMERHGAFPIDWLTIRDSTERALLAVENIGARAAIPAEELEQLGRVRQLLHQVLIFLPQDHDGDEPT